MVNLNMQYGYLNWQCSNSFPISLDAAEVAMVVVRVVGTPLGWAAAQRLIPGPTTLSSTHFLNLLIKFRYIHTTHALSPKG
jgi:hypothetical protein